MTTIPEKSSLHLLGYFPKLHGFRGELTAALDTPNIRDYVGLQHIFVEVQGQLTPFFIKLIEYKTNTTAKVRLEGIETEEQARALVKSSIYIETQYLSESDEGKVALRSIAGYKVIDEVKGEIGKVLRIEELHNNPLMVILSDKKEILLPLNGDFLKKTDKRKKEVHISAPEGLIDFYLGN